MTTSWILLVMKLITYEYINLKNMPSGETVIIKMRGKLLSECFTFAKSCSFLRAHHIAKSCSFLKNMCITKMSALHIAKTSALHHKVEHFFKRRVLCAMQRQSHRIAKMSTFLKDECNAKTAKVSAFFKDEHNAKTAPSHCKDERFFKRWAHCQDSIIASQRWALF